MRSTNTKWTQAARRGVVPIGAASMMTLLGCLDVEPGSDAAADAPSTSAALAIDDCDVQNEIPTAECDALRALYDATDGDNWNNNSGWGNYLHPSGFAGVTVQNGHVRHISLSNNGLHGYLPYQMRSFTKLEALIIFNNPHVAGPIPSGLGNLDELRVVDLGLNSLSGSIPSNLGQMSSLEVLLLDANELTGSIPASFGNLSRLEVLDLQRNHLSGELPSTLTNLTKLQSLNLHDNGCLYTEDPCLFDFLEPLAPEWDNCGYAILELCPVDYLPPVKGPQ